ncbi:MAG: hypothetical protein DSZ00_10550 [Gammaproteobacteria bacterium]|nr:MAG: hypothetical protein DSZ00_10550 [Gammaproteobacteria bacterium]RTZ76514.1 MAG: hypothetical protein DSZ02_01135 [Gammaproteobacteria bacterium]RTZ77242.1 MAG: hypothetical protein DSZ01_07075 [Gammaproteobacteria bacterium]
MKKFPKLAVGCTLLALLLFFTAPAWTKDAGHGKDYRTFHANGNIEYGQIGDSYDSDLVMYLAGNQFMVRLFP